MCHCEARLILLQRYNLAEASFSSQYSATLLVSPGTGEGIDARAFAAKTAARQRTIRTIRKHSYSLQTIYCHFAIKSFDLEGWAVGVVVRASKLYFAYNMVG